MSIELLNSVILVALGAIVAVFTNVTNQWFQSRKALRELKAKNYFERQVKCIEVVSDRITDIVLYAHFRLSELSPAEHYVFSLVMEDDENTSLQQKHMQLERTIIVESLYLPKKIENLLNSFSRKLSLAKNYEIHDHDEDIRAMQADAYSGLLQDAEQILSEIKDFVRQGYLGVNR